MRYTAATMHAKMATYEALSHMHPAWADLWRQRRPDQIIRYVGAGWACVYRLVYLVHTAQQGSMSMYRAAQMAEARFCATFPDYRAWLDR